jgi:arsenate reductase
VVIRSLVAGLLFATGLVAFVASASEDPATMSPSPTVLFVCEHGSAKSVVATAHFNRMAAARGLSVRATSRGLEPDDAVAPAAADGLGEDDLVPAEVVPRKLEAADLRAATLVVSFNDLPAELRSEADVIRWEVPPVSTDYAASRDAMIAGIDELLDSIEAGTPPDRR